jgi:hypothetical protein
MLGKYGIYFGEKNFVWADLTIEGLFIKNHNGAIMGNVDNDGTFYPRKNWNYSASQLEEIAKICCSWRDAK